MCCQFSGPWTRAHHADRSFCALDWMIDGMCCVILPWLSSRIVRIGFRQLNMSYSGSTHFERASLFVATLIA